MKKKELSIPFIRVDVRSSINGITKLDEVDTKSKATEVVKNSTVPTIYSSRIVFGILDIIQSIFPELYIKIPPIELDNVVNTIFEKNKEAIILTKTYGDVIYIASAIYGILVDYSIIYKCETIPTISEVGADMSIILQNMIENIQGKKLI